MLFPTITYATFFMVVWPLTWLASSRPIVRKLVLLTASGVFYAWWDDRYLALLAAMIVLNHAAARALARLEGHPLPRRVVLWAGVGAHLGLLGWFKYYGFFAASMTSALDRVGIEVHPPLVQVVLPLGISFLTFQAISHLVEVHRGVLTPGTLLDVATWLTFFPTVASGPITRPSELFPQLRERPDHRVEANRALGLILRGLVKKVVLASYLATALADDVFASPDRHSALEVLTGIYAYAVQLYLDFSGYTDIAIGCALLIGIRLPENFRAPYAARSVTDFWTRWHMTLSRWLRDFVFTPLALRSSRSTAATCRNLVVVMLLAGLWHGAAWTFVAFGAVHGVALAVERAVRQRRRHLGMPRPGGPIRGVLHRVVTFHVVCLGWVFFRAESLEGATDVLARLWSGGWAAAPAISGLLVAVLSATLLVQQVPRPALDRIAARAALAGPVMTVAVLALGLLAIDVFGPEGVAPFLYFGF